MANKKALPDLRPEQENLKGFPTPGSSKTRPAGTSFSATPSPSTPPTSRKAQRKASKKAASRSTVRTSPVYDTVKQQKRSANFFEISALSERANRILRYSVGSILAVGLFILICFTTFPAGTADRSFGNRNQGVDRSVSSSFVQENGKILLAGDFTKYAGSSSPRLVRLNENGSLDSSFKVGSGPDNTVSTVTSTAAGSVLIGGGFESYDGIATNRIAEINSDGTLNKGFSVGAGFNDQVRAIVVQPDGKILIGGSFTTFNDQVVGHIVRLNPDGSLDANFNPGGSGANNEVDSIALRTDGEILVAGSLLKYNDTAVGSIALLKTDGTLDETFNQNRSGANGAISDAVFTSDGGILIVGSMTSYNDAFVGGIVKLTASGAFDPYFNQSRTGAQGRVLSIATQSDGKLIIAGDFTSYNGVRVGGVARIFADGALDTSFNPGGKGVVNPGVIQTIAIQKNGNILLSGSFDQYNEDSARNTLSVLKNSYWGWRF